jgi:hypothetical protein
MSGELVMPPGRELWEKIPRESFKAWAAFVMFRDLGPERNLPKTVEALNGKPGLSMIETWSAKNHWFARAEAYDIYLDRKRRAARESEQEQAERVERGGALMLERIAMQRINGVGDPLEDGYVPPLSPAELSPQDTARFFAEGVRIRRLSDGQPTDLLKGAFMIAPADAERMVRGVIEAALPLIPEELHERFISQVKAIAAAGR